VRKTEQTDIPESTPLLYVFRSGWNRRGVPGPGGYLQRSEPVLLVGEPGTGKTHLATGLAIAACRQRRRVRFTTAAALVNQLVEAQREQSLSRMLACWSRVELIVIDELGYVPLAAELLFQVIAERAEKAAIIVTTNLPFSEWPPLATFISPDHAWPRTWTNNADWDEYQQAQDEYRDRLRGLVDRWLDAGLKSNGSEEPPLRNISLVD
jgi:DNA replication protein DnaC